MDKMSTALEIPLSTQHPVIQTRRWLRLVNILTITVLFSALVAYVIVSQQKGVPPYDYAYLMTGADLFCFDNAQFEYGWPWVYPAPFYTTFCLPYHYAGSLLLWVWMLLPFALTLWLARGRAAVLVYPPLFVLLLLGQSTWLILPLYMLAAHQNDDRSVPLWYGLVFGLGVFKPHIAVLPALWLLYRWRYQWRVLLVGVLTAMLLVLPSFLIRPGWLLEWLPKGRGFAPQSLATIASIPVKLGGWTWLDDIGPGVQALVWGFCLLVGVLVFFLLRWRRGQLALYDWVLLFAFVNPVMNDYDLIVLLPFIANRPRRLLVALTAGLMTWIMAMITGRWNMSIMVTLALLALRLWHSPHTDRVYAPNR
jgi:hypothetical protein